MAAARAPTQKTVGRRSHLVSSVRRQRLFGLLSKCVNPGERADYQRPSFCELKNWIAANGEG